MLMLMMMITLMPCFCKSIVCEDIVSTLLISLLIGPPDAIPDVGELMCASFPSDRFKVDHHGDWYEQKRREQIDEE